jgi:RimJ/RimL family protein N-acetyltransferase
MHLETERLIMHPMTPEQIRQALWNMPKVVRSFGVQMEPYGFWEMRWKRKQYRVKCLRIDNSPDTWLFTTAWLIIRKSDFRFVGDAGFKGLPVGSCTIEIHYNTKELYRGQGFMTEAVGELCNFAFSQTQHNIERITANTNLGNIASHRVLEKNGFLSVSENDKVRIWEKIREGHKTT